MFRPMFRCMWQACLARRANLFVVCSSLILLTHLCGAGPRPIRVLKFDPQAEQIELLTGLREGRLSIRVSPRTVQGGYVYLENLTQAPLTVDLPDAVAMVHVLKQVPPNGFFNNFSGLGASQGFAGNQFGQTGQPGQNGQLGSGQSLGVGFGNPQSFQGQGPIGNNFGNFSNNVMGNGLFSIPPERVVEVPYRSVCLNYGRPDPAPRMKYAVVPLDDFTTNKLLRGTIRAFGKGKLPRNSAQIACWHLTDGLGWEQMAQLKSYRLPGVYSSQVPIFTKHELRTAYEALTAIEKDLQQQEQSDTTAVAPAKSIPLDGQVTNVSSPGTR